MALRLVMMGTGTFALPTFEELIRSEHDVVGLVTQPDRTGRGHHQHVNPLKEAASVAGVDVFQPEKANRPESLKRLGEYAADLFVVAAYGQILSADLLSIPRLGAINLHGSLLPAYRGAAPVQYAVWKGEVETGVTIFQIEPKLDAGPILGMIRTPIGEKETSGELHDRLAQLAAPFCLSIINDLEAGTAEHSFQDSNLVTQAPRIKKSDGLIDWTLPSREIGWHVRAMQPWPMPLTFLHLPDRSPIRMQILDLNPIDDAKLISATPGTVTASEGRMIVRTGDGVMQIRRLQPAGKRAMSADEFLRGTRLASGHFQSE